MKDNLFRELEASVREGGAILRGEKPASRTFVIDCLNVKQLKGVGKLPMWIDRAVKWLLPREEHFFDLIERGAARAYEISSLLVDCCAATSHIDREAIVKKIHKVEHEADRVIAEVYEALNRTFVTPLDRSDIYTLAVSLEEVADAVFATALQFVVHAMEDLPEGSSELAELVFRSCNVIHTA